MNMSGRKLCCSIVLLSQLLAACATGQGGRGWGETATLTPGFDHIRKAAWNAASDPYTWVPLIGMVLFASGDNDEQVSEWAVTRTPVFDDSADADRMSDHLRDISRGAMVVTALLTPPSETFSETLWSKTKGFAVEWSATRLTNGVKVWLKTEVGRERPDGSNNRSFPSGHTTVSYSHATLARRNLLAIPMNDSLRTSLDVSISLVAAAGAWARVEANRHYPSDVLGAAAIANFISLWVHDSFMGSDSQVAVFPDIQPDRYQLRLGFAF